MYTCYLTSDFLLIRFMLILDQPKETKRIEENASSHMAILNESTENQQTISM